MANPTLEATLSAKNAHESDWLRLSPQIVSIGAGIVDGEYAIIVGVVSLAAFEAEQSALGVGLRVPPEVGVSEPASADSTRVRVVVQEIGRIVPHANSHRVRPCPGGFSVGHTRVTAGTFGCLVSFRGGPLAGRAFILSNNHVLANCNDAAIDDPIVQPGRADGGSASADVVAQLARWVPLQPDAENYVDAAIAEVRGGHEGWSDFVATYVEGIGVPSRTSREPAVGMAVEKSGRTTAHTRGSVQQVGVTTRVDFSPAFPKPLVFRDQMFLSAMSEPGDSGSVIFCEGTREAVGLLFAGSDTVTVANRINLVISSLNQALTLKDAEGRDIALDATEPLHIGFEGGSDPHDAAGLAPVVSAVRRQLRRNR